MEEQTAMAGMTAEEKEEYIVSQAMSIIMDAGDARVLAAKAVDAIGEEDFEKARALIKDAEKTQAKAHNVQTDMIQGDIRGGDEKMGYNVLFAHAQDTLMTIQVEINMTKSMLKLAEKYDARVKTLESRL